MSLALLHPDAYPEGTRLELTQLVASLQAMLGREHDAEGYQRRIWQRWILGEAQSVPNATTTALLFRSADLRNVGDMTLERVGGIVTVRTPGVYRVSCQVVWGSNNTGTRMLTIRRDGIDEAISRVPALAADPTIQTVSADVPCVAGTTFGIVGLQDSGGALNTLPATPTTASSFLTIARVA